MLDRALRAVAAFLLTTLAVTPSTAQFSSVETTDLQLVAEPRVGVRIVPRSVIIFYPMLGATLVWGTRLVAGWMLRTVGIEIPVRLREKGSNVLIYGAGRAGAELLQALRSSGTRVVGFIDQDSTLWRQNIGGVKVYGPHRLAKLVEWHDVMKCWLCPGPKGRIGLPCSSSSLSVKVRALPTIERAGCWQGVGQRSATC